MNASRVLSRLLPVAEGDVSVPLYESVRRDMARRPDIEAQGIALDGEPFHDEDDDPDAMLYDLQTDHKPKPQAAMSPTDHAKRYRDDRHADDEDVPESLLLEARGRSRLDRISRHQPTSSRQARTDAQWRAAQEHHGLHNTRQGGPGRSTSAASRNAPVASPPVYADPAAEAVWLYTNASNLDAFLLEVYQYYIGHGIWSIVLTRVLSLASEVFVLSFATFLTTCIDFSKLRSSKATHEVLIPMCMAKAGFWKNAIIFGFIVYWLIRVTSLVRELPRLSKMRDFYLHVLGIADQDLQTVSWVRIVEGLIRVQDANIATAHPGAAVRKYARYSKPQQRVNAETIANRLMRQANYYVALYNKDVLDFTLPLPFVGSRQFYSKSLEWCINFCLTDFIFDEQGSIRPFCLEVKNRKSLVQALQRRLHVAALISIPLAPFNIVRFCILFFFRYYTEFTRNPSRVSARAFTPFAEWKIREFNELDHLFQRRLRQAQPFATDYLKQFPKDKTDQACRFVAFISGAIAAVLAIATLFDPEFFLGFEVTPGYTAAFWLTVMVGVFGVAQGALPDDNEVHDPVLHLREVLMFTHYLPAHWKERLHSNEVRSEFSAMYQMKVLIFVEEILSLLVAPWILIRNAGQRSEQIVDFFREHTVHVDGIGNQCNFAVFGFKKDPRAEDATQFLQEPDGLRDDYYNAKDDKMAASMNNFAQYYSHYNHRPGGRRTQGWQPPPTWPPVLSPPPTEEGLAAAAARQGIPGQPQAVRRSGLLEARSQRPMPSHRSPKQAAHTPRDSRGRTSRFDETDGRSHGKSPLPAVSESTIIRDEADYPPPESDTDADDEPADQVGNAGVLGMLYQFSKAKTEKGPSVAI